MAEPTVQQQPVGHRIGRLVRGVPRLRRRARGPSAPPEPGPTGAPARQGVLSLRLELVVTDADGAAAALERVVGVLRPGDRVYLVGRPEGPRSHADDRAFKIWA